MELGVKWCTWIPNDEEDLKKIRNGESKASKNMGVKNYRFVHPFMRKKIPYWISSNGLLHGAEEDALQQDQTDENWYTYSISTHGSPPRQ